MKPASGNRLVKLGEARWSKKINGMQIATIADQMGLGSPRIYDRGLLLLHSSQSAEPDDFLKLLS